MALPPRRRVEIKGSNWRSVKLNAIFFLMTNERNGTDIVRIGLRKRSLVEMVEADPLLLRGLATERRQMAGEGGDFMDRW